MPPSSANVVPFVGPSAATPSTSAPAGAQAGRLLALSGGGLLEVELETGEVVSCGWLESSATHGTVLAEGDTLLVCRLAAALPVVLGRIGRYTPPQPQATVTIEATESLTLKCGEASVDLRADGKVMVRGEDVLLRAKGTQRIRAGNVAIN